MTPHLVRERQRIVSIEAQQFADAVSHLETMRREHARRQTRRWRMVRIVSGIMIAAVALALALWGM